MTTFKYSVGDLVRVVSYEPFHVGVVSCVREEHIGNIYKIISVSDSGNSELTRSYHYRLQNYPFACWARPEHIELVFNT